MSIKVYHSYSLLIPNSNYRFQQNDKKIFQSYLNAILYDHKMDSLKDIWKNRPQDEVRKLMHNFFVSTIQKLQKTNKKLSQLQQENQILKKAHKNYQPSSNNDKFFLQFLNLINQEKWAQMRSITKDLPSSKKQIKQKMDQVALKLIQYAKINQNFKSYSQLVKKVQCYQQLILSINDAQLVKKKVQIYVKDDKIVESNIGLKFHQIASLIKNQENQNKIINHYSSSIQQLCKDLQKQQFNLSEFKIKIQLPISLQSAQKKVNEQKCATQLKNLYNLQSKINDLIFNKLSKQAIQNTLANVLSIFTQQNYEQKIKKVQNLNKYVQQKLNYKCQTFQTIKAVFEKKRKQQQFIDQIIKINVQDKQMIINIKNRIEKQLMSFSDTKNKVQKYLKLTTILKFLQNHIQKPKNYSQKDFNLLLKTISEDDTSKMTFFNHILNNIFILINKYQSQQNVLINTYNKLQSIYSLIKDKNSPMRQYLPKRADITTKIFDLTQQIYKIQQSKKQNSDSKQKQFESPILLSQNNNQKYLSKFNMQIQNKSKQLEQLEENKQIMEQTLQQLENFIQKFKNKIKQIFYQQKKLNNDSIYRDSQNDVTLIRNSSNREQISYAKHYLNSIFSNQKKNSNQIVQQQFLIQNQFLVNKKSIDSLLEQIQSQLQQIKKKKNSIKKGQIMTKKQTEIKNVPILKKVVSIPVQFDPFNYHMKNTILKQQKKQKNSQQLKKQYKDVQIKNLNLQNNISIQSQKVKGLKIENSNLKFQIEKIKRDYLIISSQMNQQIEKIKRDYLIISSQMNKQKQINTNLNQQLKQINEKLLNLINEFTLKDKYPELEKVKNEKLIFTNDSIQILRKIIKSFIQQKSSIETKIKYQQVAGRVNKNQCQNYKKKVEQFQIVKTKLQTQLYNKTAQLQRKTMQIKNFQRIIQNMTKKLNDYQKQLQTKRQQRNYYQTQLQKKEVQLKLYAQDNKKLLSQIDQQYIPLKFHNQCLQNHEKQKKQSQNKCKQSQQKIKILQQSNSSLIQKINFLSDQLKKGTESQNDFYDFSQQLEFQHQKNILKQQISKLKTDLHNLSQKHKNSQLSLTQTNNKLQQLQKQLQQLQESNNVSIKQITQQYEQKLRLQTTNNNNLLSKIVQLQTELQKVRKDIQIKENQKIINNKKFQQQFQYNILVEKTPAALVQIIIKLKQQIIVGLKQQINKWKTKCTQAEVDIPQLRIKIKKHLQTIKQLKEQIQTLKNGKQKQQSIQSVKKQQNKLQQEKNQQKSLQQQSSSNSLNQSTNKQLLLVQIQQVQTKLKLKQEQCQNLTKVIEQLKIKIQQNNLKNTTTINRRNSKNDSITSSPQKVEKLNNIIRQYQDKLQKLQQKLKQVQQNCQTQKYNMNLTHVKQRNKLNQQIKRLQRSNQSQRLRSTSIIKDGNQINKNQQYQSTINKLKQQIVKLKSDLEKSVSQAKTNKFKLEGLLQQNKEKEQFIKKLEGQIERLKNQ